MSRYVFSAGDLVTAFNRTESGLCIHSIKDRKSGYSFLSSDAPLFALTARRHHTDEFLCVDSSSGWESVSVSVSKVCASILLSGHRNLQNVSVLLQAVAGPDRITWTVSLFSDNADWTLYECDYPALTFRANAQTKVFFPYGCGEVYSSAKPFRSQQNYPSYGVSMQYMALWNTRIGRGIYYGAHDPAPAYKKFLYEKKENEKVAVLKAFMPLRDIDRPCSSQTLEGTLVWQLFDGDWYDAALLYRDFFENHASWKPDISDGKRKDTPEWIRTNPHWWRKRIKDTDKYVDELTSAAADLNLKQTSPVHIYDWHQIPYDTNYPHYFPAKDIFLSGIPRLQAAGIRVMPYINGRLWDTHDRGKEDWQFTSVARPYCTKKIHDEPFLEKYPTSNIDLAIMCPSTALWQEKMQEIVSRLFNECKIDGVYIDQIGAAQAYPCEDPTHNHRAGGGTWWVESYRNLLDHVNRKMPDSGFLTTECTSDPYMKNIQGYLSWIWIKNNQVPAFMVVYNRYVVVFGRCFGAAPDAHAQNILAAQSLTYGEQMGWIFPEHYRKLRNRDFYKKCVHCREALGSYFYDGNILRSPVISDSRLISTKKIAFEAYDGFVQHTAAFSEIWERKDGKHVLLLINASGREDRPTIRTQLIPDGIYTPLGDLSSPVCFKNGSASLVLPPHSVSYILY